MGTKEIGFFVLDADPRSDPLVFKYIEYAEDVRDGAPAEITDLEWNDRIGYITLAEEAPNDSDWWSADDWKTSWHVEKLAEEDDTPDISIVRPDCIPDGSRAILTTGPCRVRHPHTLKWNQPIYVTLRAFQVSNEDYATTPIKIMWGERQWKIELSQSPSIPDAVYYNENWDDPDAETESWVLSATGYLVPRTDGTNTVTSAVQGTTVNLKIEPKPPHGIAITNYASGGGMIDVYVFDTVTVEAWEIANDWKSTYGFYRDGNVEIEVPSSSMVYVRGAKYKETGSFVSEQIEVPYLLSVEPYSALNTTNPMVINSQQVGRKIPGTFPEGGDADPSMDVTITPEGEDPYVYTLLTFTVDFEASEDQTRTPFFKNLSLYHEGEQTEVSLSDLNFSDYVLAASVSMSKDQSERTGTITVNNTGGQFNRFIDQDAIPVQIQCDGVPVFTGYTTEAEEELLGPAADDGEADSLLLTRKLKFNLRDRWARLENNILMPTRETVCDWLYQNQAIESLLRRHGGFLPAHLNVYSGIAEDDPTLPGPTASVMLMHDYNRSEPSWMPEMGQSLGAFVQLIHDDTVGEYWEMFFDADGSFYYQPQYNHMGYETTINFIDSTSVMEANFSPLVGYQIIGEVTESLDYTDFRNEFLVVGQWRDPGVFNTDGTIRPHMVGKLIQDPLKFFGTPISVYLSNPRSWNDESYEYYVGERRSVAYVNPALCTEAECCRVADVLWMKFSAPNRTWKFQAPWVEGARPGYWATMHLKNAATVVRIESMEINWVRIPDHWRGTWIYLCDYVVSEVKNPGVTGGEWF